MVRIRADGSKVKYQKYAPFASDDTVQRSNRPSSNHIESKKYISNNRNLYSYIVEVALLPTGLAIGSTPRDSGFVANTEIR